MGDEQYLSCSSSCPLSATSLSSAASSVVVIVVVVVVVVAVVVVMATVEQVLINEENAFSLSENGTHSSPGERGMDPCGSPNRIIGVIFLSHPSIPLHHL